MHDQEKSKVEEVIKQVRQKHGIRLTDVAYLIDEMEAADNFVYNSWNDSDPKPGYYPFEIITFFQNKSYGHTFRHVGLGWQHVKNERQLIAVPMNEEAERRQEIAPEDLTGEEWQALNKDQKLTTLYIMLKKVLRQLNGTALQPIPKSQW